MDSGRNLYPQTTDLLQKANAHSIGFEDQSVTFADYQRMTAGIPNIEWIPLGDAASAIRQIKDRDEIRRIAIAEEIGDRAFTYATERMKAGMTEKEVALLLETSMRKDGASGTSFDTIVASGVRGALPHGVPTDKPLADGDFVVMDFGCVFEGYCSDMTRTVAIGHATERMREVYSILSQAQRYALQVAAPNLPAKELDAAARNCLETFGYAKYFGHSLGHGVGIEIHEAPNASPTSQAILQAGMTVTVEPGVYLEDEFGIRIEDLITITGDGYQNLTHSPKELLILS